MPHKGTGEDEGEFDGLSRQEEDVEKTFRSWSACPCIALSEVWAHVSTERTHEL